MGTYTDVPPTANDQCIGQLAVKTTGSVNVKAVGIYWLPTTWGTSRGTTRSEDPHRHRDGHAEADRDAATGTSPHVECNDPATRIRARRPRTRAPGLCRWWRQAPANMGAPGTYSISYRATDPSGNSAVLAPAR